MFLMYLASSFRIATSLVQEYSLVLIPVVIVVVLLLMFSNAARTAFIGAFLFFCFSAMCFLGGHLVYANIGVVNEYYGDTNNLENVFTPVGVFFSSLASLGAIFAIYLQSRQFSRQQFESNFYNLLNIHRENAGFIIKDDHENCLFSKTYFLLKDLYMLIADKEYSSCELFSMDVLASINELIDTLRQEDNSILDVKYAFKIGHDISIGSNSILFVKYFHHLYHLVKFTRNNAPKLQRRFYYGLIRAQLSPYEVAVLYYNTLIIDDCQKILKKQKFKYLIEKTAMLHNMKKEMIFDGHRIGKYADYAFDMFFIVWGRRFLRCFMSMLYEVDDALSITRDSTWALRYCEIARK